jgi:putative ABC transport system permease protein
VAQAAFRLIAVSLLCVVATLPDFSHAAPSLDAVALPRRSAAQLGVTLGDLLEVSPDPGMVRPQRVRVAVVWDPPEHPADVVRGDLVIQFHLSTLEALLDRHDLVDRVVVRVAQSARAEEVRDELNGIGRGYEAYTAADLARQTSRAFVVISQFHRAIALITMLASGIFLVTLMSLKLTELRREIGALRLLGVGRRTILLTVLGLGVVVAIAGTVIGVGLGAVLVVGINKYYQPLFATHLRFAFITAGTLQVVALAGVLVGIGVAMVVGVRLVRGHPLDQVGR